MIRMIRSEWLKVRGTVVWLLAVVSPIAAGLVVLLNAQSTVQTGAPWLTALQLMAALHALLFLPMLTGIFAGLVCRYEHAGGGWKQLLALPVSRSQVYLVKFLFVMLLIAVTQLLFLAALLLIGTSLGFAGEVPWAELLRSAAGGWAACLPLAALQLAVSTAWPNFAAPMAVNVIFTIPNLLIVNSAHYGPYYPWAQPLLAMMPHAGNYNYGAFAVPAATLLLVIGGSFVLFLASGWIYFVKKAV
ncbi:ABC transporter permease [Paenibacillus humicola]|uniref:ABC transporter permease n=1 Tax=Paenibacillus humicola TaxID=3110540 RepID=UPI00237BBBA0|nr:ABC transporter permease [Paenibacillus humicola]